MTLKRYCVMWLMWLNDPVLGKTQPLFFLGRDYTTNLHSGTTDYWYVLWGPLEAELLIICLGKLHPTLLGLKYTNHFHRRTADFQSLLWGDLEQNCWLSAGENSVLLPWSWLHSWWVAFCIAHYWAVSLHCCYITEWVTAALHSFSSFFF